MRFASLSLFRFCNAILLMVLISLTATFAVPRRDAKALERRREDLRRAIDEEWEYEMRESPELASILGDLRYNDRWSDSSLAHIQQQRQDATQWLARFSAIDATDFPEQEKLNQALMVRNLKENLESFELKTYEMPINQFSGVHLQLAQFVAILPFNSVKHYEDYLTRLHKFPHLIDDLIVVMQQGVRDKLMPPRFLLEKTVVQCKDIAGPEGEDNVFAQSVKHIPDAIPEAARKRFHDAIIAAVNNEVRPAYEKLADFLAKDYAPKGRTEPGVSSLPNGDALYRFNVRQATTINMDPEAIHQLGLKEVARIEAEQLAIAKKLGFADLKLFRTSLKADPKLKPSSREQLVQTYKRYIDQMQLELPKLFGLLPKSAVEVHPMEGFREKDAASADYQPGTPDGSRPGIVYVNTSDFQNRTLTNVESTAYHEGVPGHHMQISIAQTLPGLPMFRKQAGYTAYVEGWALYAERLGKDIGFYQDPYSYYGHLSEEMLRAVRLVLDTGVHYKHWTRQQMIDFFREHTSDDEPDMQAETDRYIAIPGQALAYKLGQLEILRLREQAEQELGAHYDVRAFHDEILNGGALPLDVLEKRVTTWIAVQKSSRSNPK
jgi:uncharacterized protein (DUF885 family)